MMVSFLIKMNEQPKYCFRFLIEVCLTKLSENPHKKNRWKGKNLEAYPIRKFKKTICKLSGFPMGIFNYLAIR